MFGMFKLKTKAEKLFDAIIEEKTAKALKLITKMEDFNQLDYGNRTALILATNEGNVVIAEKLIEKMDNVYQINK